MNIKLMYLIAQLAVNILATVAVVTFATTDITKFGIWAIIMLITSLSLENKISERE